MARRNRDLAGLAALGALGLYAARGGKNTPEQAARIPVDDRGTMTGDAFTRAAAARAPIRLDEDFAERETGIIPQDPRGLNEYGDRVGLQRPANAPARLANASARPAANRSMAAAARESQEPYKNPQRGPSFEEISAYNRSQQTAGVSTKPREGVVQASTRSMAPARPQTREEAIAQIPTSTGSRYSSVASDTDPSLLETGSEFGRNVGNTFAALTPLGGGFGKVGAELATAKGAAERAAKSRELAQEAIRTQKPTKFTSTKSTAPKRTSEATKSRVKKFNEEEAGVEFKRGGSAKVKKMASGGFTSSASSRADGIASRGKTKCKMY